MEYQKVRIMFQSANSRVFLLTSYSAPVRDRRQSFNPLTVASSYSHHAERGAQEDGQRFNPLTVASSY